MIHQPKLRFVYYKLTTTWVGSPVGFWDTELYKVFRADVRKCFKINPRFLT